MTKHEMKTLFNYNTGEQTAAVYTMDRAVMRKLDKLVKDYIDSYKLIKQTDIDKANSMSKSHVTYHKSRTLNAAQRE